MEGLTSGDDIRVDLQIDLATLRSMHLVVSKSLDQWPGGHPAEQAMLTDMKRQLYSILMSVLIENDLI
jgi:hypothetical protein